MTAQGNTSGTGSPAGDPEPAGPAAPFAGLDAGVIAGKVFTEAAVRVSSVVKPAAAAAIATTFSFPLILMVAVLFFLLGQRRLDDHDPKLRTAPRSTADAMLEFQDEDRL